MLKIIMIRHGRTYGNSLGKYVGMTDESILPEERGALLPVRDLVDAVFVSPMKRCIESTEALFPELPAGKLIRVEGLKECDFGDFEYMTYQELTENADYQRWIDSNGTIGFPGGETKAAFKRRTLAAFDEVVRSCRRSHYRSIGMVVHGGTIMSILEEYGFPQRDYFDWKVENGEGYRLRTLIETWDTGRRQIVVDGYIYRKEHRA